MSSWRWNPIVCWRNRSISRCTWDHRSGRRAQRRGEIGDRPGLLLSEGIGDTLRVSLAADPVEEIKVGFDILKSLRIRARGINFIACPTCSRQEFDVIGTVNALEQRLEDIITPMDVSIIGCVVNGPGEALVSTLGVTGGNKKSGLYEDGVRKDRLDNDDMIDQLEARIRAKASMLDEARRIDVQQVEENNVLGSDTLPVYD
jgi:(E)-4-hydroxy-3-methylbut-2-enyl-diphosphate synthase